MKLFGSSGIRGIVNQKITPDLARRIGETVGERNEKILIGRDPRKSGEMIRYALISGINSVGADTKDARIISTSTLAFNTRYFDCGLMITASHNPEEYNGIKFWNPDGSSFNTDQMKKIEHNFSNKKPDRANWNSIGKHSKYEDPIKNHIDAILNQLKTDLSQKVIIDCANGPTGDITPKVLKKMGCEVTTFNAQPDGTFPGHPSEPTKQNLEDLSKMMQNSDRDLAIAHDGDGDRMVAFDKTGRFLGGDELLALFADIRSGTVVVPVNSSMVIDELADDVIRTKVGDVFVSETLKENDANFGGEPSGTWIFPEISYGPDGVFSAAYLTVLNEDIDIVEKVNNISKYPRKKISLETKNKEELMNKIKKMYRETYTSDDLDFIDGVRFEEEEGWGLIRPSGTEPKIRITIEAKSENILSNMMEEAQTRIKEVKE